MSQAKTRIAMAAAAALMAMVAATPASAGTGCNGVVDWFTWGCAGWDNNNGPQFPYYRKPIVKIPVRGTQIIDKNGLAMAVRNGVTYPIIGQDGNSMTMRDASRIIGNDAGSLTVKVK